MRTFFVLLLSLPAIVLGQSGGIDSRFHTLDEIYTQLADWQAQYPQLMFCDTIGFSSNTELPIVAVKISDNPTIREDEPRILLIGQHHAEEILGNEIVLSVIEDLLTRGMQTSRFRAFLQNMEMWFIPTLNPEGLEFVMGGEDITFRKNYTDNNGNGVFDFEPGIGNDTDGVDLNRNYDFCWTHGDSLYQGDNDYYRGPDAFSENEVQAVAALAREQRFLYSFSYHSARSGTPEIIYYPWNFANTGKKPPDFDVIKNLTNQVAGKILRQNGVDHYRTHHGTSRKGNAHNWFYSEVNSIQLLIEVGTNDLQPDSTTIEQVVDRNKEGVYYMFDRSIGYFTDSNLLTGHITDAVTGAPLRAHVTVLEKTAPYLEGRSSDTGYGRYYRPLMPGTYTVHVHRSGYHPQTRQVIVGTDRVVADFTLEPRPQFHTAFMFTDYSSGDTLDVHTKLRYLDGENGDPIERSTDIASSSATVLLDSGMWHMEVQRLLQPEESFVFIDTLMIKTDTTIHTALPAGQLIFDETFNDLGNWVGVGEWTTYLLANGDAGLKSHSGTYYSNVMNQTLQYDESITLNAKRATLSIDCWHELEWEYDSAAVEIQNVGDTTWSKVLIFTGHPDSGDTHSMYNRQLTHANLSPWSPGEINLRLHIWSDSTFTDRGWYVSRLVIRETDASLGSEQELSLPARFRIRQNFPNPFNPTTVIPFVLPAEGEVDISIYNILGQRVYHTSKLYEQPGEYRFRWNGINTGGTRLSSGIYFVRVRWKHQVRHLKIAMVR